MLPYLNEIKTLGVNTFIDCTPKYLGRDVELLRELADLTGLQIVTNTGLYARENFLPSEAYEITPDALAEKWITEFKTGINGTPIKPGFIKTAVEGGKLRKIEKKMLRAAAITANETGMTIATHTGVGKTALEILDLLEEYNIPPNKWVFVHAHMEKDISILAEVAHKGAWIELDGLAWKTERAKHYHYTKYLISHGFSRQLLLSHDAGWYHIGEENGGQQIPYSYLINKFIPQIKRQGIKQKTINLITRKNPGRAFSI
jgi:phosphotriesterase-related protein